MVLSSGGQSAISGLILPAPCFAFQEIVGNKDWYTLLFLYNFYAFALELPMGTLLDESPRRTMAVQKVISGQNSWYIAGDPGAGHRSFTMARSFSGREQGMLLFMWDRIPGSQRISRENLAFRAICVNRGIGDLSGQAVFRRSLCENNI